MMDDPIVEEVRRIRDRQAGELDYDLDKIFRDLKDWRNWPNKSACKPSTFAFSMV